MVAGSVAAGSDYGTEVCAPRLLTRCLGWGDLGMLTQASKPPHLPLGIESVDLG